MTVIIIHFFEILATILATIFIKKYAQSTEKFFMYFLWFTLFIETVGYCVRTILNNNNIWVFNLYAIISFLFFFNWYYKIIKRSLFKKIIYFSCIIFIIIVMKNLFLGSLNNYHHQVSTFVTGAMIIIITSIFYFSELLNSDEVMNIKHNLRFWIATGLLLFHVGLVPFIVFSKEFGANSNLRNIILVSLNVILYTCYSFGFIWVKKEDNINEP